MSRANSLKKAVRQIIEHAEKTLDEQNASHNHKIVVVRPMSLTVKQQVRDTAAEASLVSPDDDSTSARNNDNEQLEAENLRTSICGGGVDAATSSTAASSLFPTTTQLPYTSNLCASSNVSPVDPNVTLPVPRDQTRKLSNASTNASTISAEELEDEVVELDKNDIPLIDGSDNSDDLDQMCDKAEKGVEVVDVDAVDVVVQHEGDLKGAFPKIEVESPSSSARTQKDSDDSVIEADNDTSIGQDSSCASNNNNDLSQMGAAALGAAATLEGAGGLLAVPGSKAFPRGSSPRGSRRISMGSLLKPLEVEIPTSPKSSKGDHSDMSYSSAANSPFSSSAHSSPNKSSSHQAKRKTLPIVNPLVSHPAWPAVASGGVVSKVLLANADTICAVASPLMDPEIDPDDLMLGFEEKCVMNNYFGIGIDAKITLDFHLKREEHPEKLRSRTRNFLWYGVLGGKEFLQKSCKNLEQRVQLECDGKRLPLPSLQGIVILNIQR